MRTFLASRAFSIIGDLIGVGVWSWLLYGQVTRPWSWLLPLTFLVFAMMTGSLVGKLLGWDKEIDDEGDTV